MKLKKSFTALAAVVLAVSPVAGLANELKSDGSIKFEPDASEVEPIRPVYPGKPGTPGPLSIDIVPDFHFGQQFITQDDMTYWAISQPLGHFTDDVWYVGTKENRTDSNGNRFTQNTPGASRILNGQVRNGYASAINVSDKNEASGYITVYCGQAPSPIDPATNVKQAAHCTPDQYLILTDAAGNPIYESDGRTPVKVEQWDDVYEQWWDHQVDPVTGDYVYGPLHAQITDRRGAQDGWNLVVRQDADFTGKIADPGRPGTDTPVTLTGARITLHGATTPHGESGRGRRLNVEAASHSADSTGVKYGVNVFSGNITLDPGVPSRPLFTSDGGLAPDGSIAGLGTHIIDFGGTDDGSGIEGSVNTPSNVNDHRSTGVSITIPGNTMHNARYTTTFTWSLENGPTNSLPTLP